MPLYSQRKFEVVEILKKEEATSEVAIEQLAGGGTIRSKRRKVAQHETSHFMSLGGYIYFEPTLWIH